MRESGHSYMRNPRNEISSEGKVKYEDTTIDHEADDIL